MATTEITTKQINKGARAINELTGSLRQTLKTLGELYATVLPDTDGLTVEGWFTAMGVFRHENKGGHKSEYTCAAILEAWHPSMKKEEEKEGKKSTVCGVFGNVPVLYFDLKEGPDGLMHKSGEGFKVYSSKEEAEKRGGRAISVYGLQAIEPTRWSMSKITKGLKQTAKYSGEKSESARHQKSVEDWNAVKECWIMRPQEDGSFVAEQVSKEQCEYARF